MTAGTNYIYEDELLVNAAPNLPFNAATDKVIINSASASETFLSDSGGLFVGTTTPAIGPGIILQATGLQDVSVNNFLFGDGSFLYVDTNTGNDIFLTGNNDQAIGRAGDDTITGLGGDDLIMLGGAGGASYGHDVINGGFDSSGTGANQIDTGIDTLAFFEDANRGANVNLTTGVVTGGAAASGATILFNSIDNVVGTSFNDTITGSAGANLLQGRFGDDRLNGSTGNDTLVGADGADTLNGGGGVDKADYSGSPDVVNVNLATGIAQDGNMTPMMDPFSIDTLVSIENVGGGAGNDTLTGSTANNRLEGVNGNDSLVGDAGKDVLLGGSGNDFLDGGADADNLQGGGGNDTVIWDAAGTDTRVDGGTSNGDALKILGSGVTLDLTVISNTLITGIEIVKLTGSGNNTLTVSLADVLAISSTSDTLRVDGNTGDVVNRGAGWVTGADQPIGLNTYHTYTQGLATLLVETDITVH